MIWLVLSGVAAAMGAPETAPVVHSTAEAIAMADAATVNGKSGRFEMTVAAGEKTTKATFLNSSADYRAADDLTFNLSPVVAQALSKKYGAPAAEYLRGKHIVVDGVVRRQLIVNTFSGRPTSNNRWQHEVRIDRLAQIVSIG